MQVLCWGCLGLSVFFLFSASVESQMEGLRTRRRYLGDTGKKDTERGEKEA